MPSATSDNKLTLKTLKYELIFSPIYGIFGSLGLYCFFNYMVMSVFHEKSRYPHFAPFCVLAGTVSLCICIVSLAGHIICLTRGENKSGKAIALRIGITAGLTLLFFLLSGFLWEPLRTAVSQLIKQTGHK